MKRPVFNRAQARAFPYAMKHPYSILALDPRLGKSRVVIEVREKLKGNCLVLCPSYLVLNWVKEIRKWAGSHVDITAIQKGKDIYEVCDTDYVVVSYDLAKKAEHFFDWADMVVIDEGHNLKSMDAKRTQFIHRCIFEYSIQRLHILTGTPIKNRVKEFYSLLALMNYNPRVAQGKFLDLYPSEIDFADQFSNRERYQLRIGSRIVTILKWTGLENLAELKTHLKGKYLRIKAQDGDLPPVTHVPVLISDSPDNSLLKSFNMFFAGEGRDSVKIEAKVEAAKMKVPFTIKYVKDLLEEVECCVVYSDHVIPAETIAAAFGVKPITGKMSAVERAKLVEQFQAGRSNLIVSTVGALKEGRDLFRAKDLVWNDYPWVPGDLKQVINRIRAIGETSPRTIHEMLGSPQDETILDTLKEKTLVIEAAT